VRWPSHDQHCSGRHLKRRTALLFVTEHAGSRAPRILNFGSQFRETLVYDLRTFYPAPRQIGWWIDLGVLRVLFRLALPARGARLGRPEQDGLGHRLRRFRELSQSSTHGKREAQGYGLESGLEARRVWRGLAEGQSRILVEIGVARVSLLDLRF